MLLAIALHLNVECLYFSSSIPVINTTFNFLVAGTAGINSPSASQGITNHPEPERHDSPDFLTADEDDRTTTVAYYRVKYQDESVASNMSGVEDNEGSSSHTGTVLEMPESSDLENEKCQSAQNPKVVGSTIPTLPLPPTETKGFMDIPPEALRANLALSLYKENAIRPEAEQQQQESGRANWGSGREERQEVVCEQPVSAQV